ALQPSELQVEASAVLRVAEGVTSAQPERIRSRENLLRGPPLTEISQTAHLRMRMHAAPPGVSFRHPIDEFPMRRHVRSGGVKRVYGSPAAVSWLDWKLGAR